MAIFGGGYHINLYHQYTRKSVEDGTLKIQSIHLKDILEEPINYNLKANGFNFNYRGKNNTDKTILSFEG